MGSHSLLQGIFLTQGSNLGPLHCSRIPYCLSSQRRASLLYYQVAFFRTAWEALNNSWHFIQYFLHGYIHTQREREKKIFGNLDPIVHLGSQIW